MAYVFNDDLMVFYFNFIACYQQKNRSNLDKANMINRRVLRAKGNYPRSVFT